MAYYPFIQQGTPLQGGTPSLQGGVNPMSPTYNPMGNVSSPTPSTPAPRPAVKPSSPSATSSVTPKQQYVNDLSSRYGLSGGTVYDKSANKGLTLDEFKSATGISNPDWKSLKFDTAYSPPSVTSPSAQMFIDNITKPAASPAAAPAASSPKSAYLEFLRKQFNPDSLDAAGKNLSELSKRTNEEILRARAEEDRIRKNEIGQVESGLNHSLNESARLSNKSLADLALAKGYASDEYNRLLGFGESLYNLEEAERTRMMTEADKALLDTAPAILDQFESLKSKTDQDMFIRGKAAELGVSIDRLNSVLKNAITARDAAKTKDLMQISEGEAIWDPNTGEFVYKNPKTYSPSEMAKLEGSSESSQFLANTASQATQAINNIKSLIPSASFGRSAALQESLPPYLQSAGYRNMAAQLDYLKSNIMFGTLQAMREASKTGGALGQVSDVEGRLLQSALGTLSLSQDKAQFEQNLNQIMQSIQNWSNAVNQYGGSSGPAPSGGGNDPLGLGFNRVGNTSASTPYLQTLGPVTGLNGSPLWKWGLDIDLKVGQPVPNAVSGKVIAVRPASQTGGFGNQVKIQAADGTTYWYSHLAQPSVKVGQYIPRGQIVGLGGNTGNTIAGKGGDGSHLDLTAVDKNGKYIPPQKIAQMLKQVYV